MSSFLRNKLEYMDKLYSNEEILMATLFNGMSETNPKVIRACQIILNPDDEFELEIANALYSIQDNTIKLAYGIDAEEVKRIPYEENEAYKFIINVMNMKYDRDEIATYVDSYDSKSLAKLVYDYAVGNGYEEDAFEYVSRKTNLNKSNLEDVLEAKIRFDDATAVIENITILDTFSEEEVSRLKELTTEYNKLCEAGRLNKGNQKRLDN